MVFSFTKRALIRYSGETKVFDTISTLGKSVVIRTAVILVMLTSLTVLTSCTAAGTSWLTASKERIDVIVPEGYEGPVLIAYQVPTGMVPEKLDQVWQYRLQDDGALLLRTDPLPGVGQFRFYYELKDGTREPIPTSSCFDDETYDGVVVCTGMMTEVHYGRNLRPNQSFSIARIDDLQQWTTEDYFRLLELYFDNIVLSEDT